MESVEASIIHSMESILVLKKGSRSVPGARVLTLLTQTGAISQQKIADRLGIRLQSVVQTLAHLERNGYIRRERNSEDRREKLVNITPEGEQQLEVHESFSSLSARILAPLSDSEKKTLAELLDKVIEGHANDS